MPDGFWEYCAENDIPVLGICYGMQVGTSVRAAQLLRSVAERSGAGSGVHAAMRRRLACVGCSRMLCACLPAHMRPPARRPACRS